MFIILFLEIDEPPLPHNLIFTGVFSRVVSLDHFDTIIFALLLRRNPKLLNFRPLGFSLTSKMLHMAEILRENALQNAELGLIYLFTLVPLQHLPEVSLLALVDHLDPVDREDSTEISIHEL